MKLIGYIVVIALIVYVSMKVCAKKKTSDSSEAEESPEESKPQNAGEFLQQLVDQPAEVIKEKLNQIEQAAEKQVDVLSNPTPLISQVPPAEEVLIIQPKPVIPKTSLLAVNRIGRSRLIKFPYNE